MIGPRGASESTLAARLRGLLPALDAKEALEVTMPHSVASQLSEGGLIQQPPQSTKSFSVDGGAGLWRRTGQAR